VSYGDIARGYELPNGEVVVLTDGDFAELPLSSSRTIDVLSFVEANTIDPIQLSRCYYCEPVGADAKPYFLLREALERTGKVAVVKVALRGRESLALLRPREGIIILQLLLWPDEVRRPRFAFLNDDVPLRPQERRMAESYVAALTGEVDPEEKIDRYRVALEQLVAAKVAGLEVQQPPASAADSGKAVDLMDVLRRSVEEAKRSRGGGAQGAKPPAKSAKKTAPKKTAAKNTTAKNVTAKSVTAKKTAAKNVAEKNVTAKRAAKRPAE